MTHAYVRMPGAAVATPPRLTLTLTPTLTLTLTLALTLTLTRWVRNQEREFAAAGLLVHGAAAVFAALDAARQQESQTAMQMAS